MNCEIFFRTALTVTSIYIYVLAFFSKNLFRRRDHGLADLFSLIAQARKMLRFPFVFSHETRQRNCGFVLYYATSPPNAAFSLLFSHTRDDHGLAHLFSLTTQVRQMLRFTSVFSYERRQRTCGLVFSCGTSPANVSFSPCFLIRKTTTDLRTCFLLWHKSAKCCVFLLFSHTKDARGLADLFSLKGINLFLNCFKRNKSAQVRVAFCLEGRLKLRTCQDRENKSACAGGTFA